MSISKRSAYESLNERLTYDVSPPELLGTLAIAYNEAQSPDSTFA